MCFLPAQWVMAVYLRSANLCCASFIVPALLKESQWTEQRHTGAKVLTNIGSNTQMHQHSSVKSSEERTHAHASLCLSGCFLFWCFLPGSSVESESLADCFFFSFFFFLFCKGMTLPSVSTQECIESIFSSLHLKGRRCQVVQRSQRVGKKQQQREWKMNSVIPWQTKTASYSRGKEGITGKSK